MKKIRLFNDETIALDLEKLASNLNEICKSIYFLKGQTKISFKNEFVSYPNSFDNLDEGLLEEVESDFKAIILTAKRYDNNYFFQFSGNLTILSFFGWDMLTTLPISNGTVFFISEILALHIDHSFRHQRDDEEPKPECIYNFGENKKTVDIGMRSSMVCSTCMKRIRKKRLTKSKENIFLDLKIILNDLGNASKWETEIFEFWSIKKKEYKVAQIDTQIKNRSQVFISYSHHDTLWLQRLKKHLRPFERNSTIHVWDDTKIKYGRDWRQDIEEALKKTKVAILLISEDFLASDFIANNELPSLLSAAKNDGAKIMSIIINPCSLKSVPDLTKFQFVNQQSKTLVDMDEGEQGRCFVNLVEEIHEELTTDISNQTRI